ncbi:MAG: ABC transporter ATP-binding protein [Bacilli bacterium]|nr:ABC transporter ATP-binding protein [Bacilli bacterium]
MIDDGKLVAKGRHENLLKNSEIYQNLYMTESLNS